MVVKKKKVLKKLIIHTKYFGETEIDEGKIIIFPKGLPAFEDINEFVLIDLPGNSSFYCLQSIKKPEVAFILICPWDFFPEYDINIPNEDLDELNITKQEQVLIYNIVTIPQDPGKMTANLLAPILINNKTLKGKQVILHHDDYHTKHPLFSESEAV